MKTNKMENKTKKSCPFSKRSIAAMIFIWLTVFTVIAASLTAYMSSGYFDLYIQGQWFPANMDVCAGLTLTSTLLGWITFILLAWMCCLAHRAMMGKNAEQAYKNMKKIASVVVTTTLLAFLAQAVSCICWSQLLDIEATGTKLSNSGITASVMSGLALICSCFALHILKRKVGKSKPQVAK